MGIINSLPTGPAPVEVCGHSNGVAACQHDVQFYFDDRFLIRSLSTFVGPRLASGSSVLIVATKSHRESLAEELERAGVDLPAAIAEGRYLALDAAETLARFTRNGFPDESLFRELIGGLVSCSAAVARGQDDKVIIFGEMVALLWQRGEAQAALRLEQLWNGLSETHSFRLRCAYPIASFDRSVHTEIFSRICSEHQLVIPAEDYSGLVDASDRLRTVVRLQHAEQVLKRESAERQVQHAESLQIQDQNQELVRELRQRKAVEDELRRFTRRLLSARDEEQRRIAAELHENTAQLLAALSLYFGVLKEEKASLNPRLASVIDNSRSVSDSLLNEIRKLSHLLHPPTLEDMGLGSALREYMEQIEGSTRMRVHLEVADDLGRFDRNLEITVFRIVEEALSNVHPESAAAVTVRLSRSAAALMAQIQVEQSGTGSLEGASRVETKIVGIHERAMEYGGSVQFTSDRSRTMISVTLPLENAGVRTGTLTADSRLP